LSATYDDRVQVSASRVVADRQAGQNSPASDDSPLLLKQEALPVLLTGSGSDPIDGEMTIVAYQALNRFGLGRRGASPLSADPVGQLKAQIAQPDRPSFPPKLPTATDGLIIWREQNRLDFRPGESLVGPLLHADMAAQMEQALTTDADFRERLVFFWANHFTVSTRAGGVAAVVGPFIREAIRPHVTGRFLDMLLAVMRHPAMLMYLDNSGSIGPNSPVGLRQHRGLNENLARECLELHTLGVDGGYSQADVTEFARILTGWSIDLGSAQPGFVFREETHEPGEKHLLGKRFPPGEAGGVIALDFLAGHPATHRHLATKLVRHFVADDAPEEAVRAIEGVLRETDGDLGEAALALVALPAAWQPLAKLRSPADYVIAALRALDLPAAMRPAPEAGMILLGQKPWEAPLPNGWPDDAASWVAPEAMLRRADWAYAVSARASTSDPAAVAEAALGPLLRPQTLAEMGRAGARRDAMTLFLTSPEFQRR